MSGEVVAVILIPVFAIIAGMWFGRKSPYLPEYGMIDAMTAKAMQVANRPS